MGTPSSTAMHSTAALGSQPAAQQLLATEGAIQYISASFSCSWFPACIRVLCYLRQCKCTKSSFKLQLWQASHCTGFTSAIFTLPSQLSVSQSSLPALPTCFCISGIVLSPLKGHTLGLTVQSLICSGPLGPSSLCVFMQIFSTC